MSDGSVPKGRTIQLFLVDGEPGGLVIASIHGWTGSVLVGTQATFSRLLARDEVDRTGIYILYGPDPSDPLKMRAYIGESAGVRGRIAESASERGFWETAVVITTSDETLTKGHVLYLEARLLAMTRAADRAELDNSQEPSAESRRLPEADRANMESFLANIRVILPMVGVDLLKPKPKAVLIASLDAVGVGPAPQFEIRHKSGIYAKAIEEEGEFIVLAGSKALRDTGYHLSTYGDLKRELIEQKVLADADDKTTFQFTRSYSFKSPSAAAAVVLDRNSNGRYEWKVIDQKKTYDEWQRQRALALEKVV